MLCFELPPAGQVSMIKSRSAQRPMCQPDVYAERSSRSCTEIEQSSGLLMLPRMHRILQPHGNLDPVIDQLVDRPSGRPTL